MDPVRKALWFVEGHLEDDRLSLDTIAAACGVSGFHLTRAFGAVLGVPLMRYVRGRRLSDAAKALAAGAEDILALALAAGYGSHEAFTRAFREQFGLTPEQLRARGNLHGITLTEALPMSTNTAVELAAPRFENVAPRVYAGFVARYPCAAPDGIPAQWQRAAPFLVQVAPEADAPAYGVCYNFDAEGNFDYLCGVELKPSAPTPDGMTRLETPALKYAVFSQPSHITTIRPTFAAIWSQWFPSSAYEAIDAPTLERYGPEFDPLTGNGGFEIWIAVKERA